MTIVYVIWQHVPDSIEIFKLQAEGETLEFLKKCNNHYVNTSYDDPSIEEAVERLSIMLENETPIYDDTTENPPVITVEAGIVIVTGFIM